MISSYSYTVISKFLFKNYFLFPFIIIEEMHSEPKSLFTKGKSNNLGKLYGKWKVKRQGCAHNAELY
jgi:hypothetical protein